MSKYSSQEKIEGKIKRSLTEEELVNIDNTIEAISNAIGAYLNRTWNDIDYTEDIEETTRYYDGNGKRELFINDVDFESISKIELLGSDGEVYETITETDDMIFYPLNSDTKNSIVLREYYFPCGRANVKLTGVFTSGTVPNAVVEAVTDLISTYLTINEVNGTFESENIEGYSYKIKTQSELTSSEQKIFDSVNYLKKITF